MSDTYEPTYLTVDASGRIGANFTGHMKAAGLDLDAGDTDTPPDERRIRWLRTSDGLVAAGIYGWDYSVGNRDGVAVESFAVTGARGAQARLRAIGPGPSIAALYEEVDSGGTGGRVTAEARADAGTLRSVTAIDALGQSSFLQLDGVLTRRRLELLITAVDLPSTAAQTGGVVTLTGIAGLAVGDWCFYVGRAEAGNTGRSFIVSSQPICTTAGEHVLRYFNAAAAISDPGSANYYFLVIHNG